MDVKASEVINELRRAARAHEVYKEAVKVAEFFLDLEKKEKELKDSIAALEVEKVKLDESINKQVEEANKKLLDLKKKHEVAEESIKEVVKRADEQRDTARKEAHLIVQNAHKQAEVIKQSTDALRAEERQAREEMQNMRHALEALVGEMHAKREQLLKAFS